MRATRRAGVRTGLITLAMVALVGCVSDGGDDPDETDATPDDGVIVDGGEDDMSVEPRDIGPRLDDGLLDDGPPDQDPDDGPPADMGDAAPPPDDAMVEPDQGGAIDTCEAACDRYAECDRLGDRFGDYDGCLQDCERISRAGRPDDWFDCVELESCNLLRLCPVPEIEPLGCDEVCDLVDTCEVDLALPDCQATCEANADAFRPCGEALYGGLCDADGFTACVVRDVFPECRTLCDTGVACNLVRDAECITDCLDDRLSGDPLGALRSRQLASCVQFAPDEDCAAVDACFFPGGPGAPIDRAAFCALYEGCGFGFFFSCDEAIAELGDQIDCGAELMRQRCPFDEFEMLDACFFGGGPDPRAQPCNRLCEAQEVCDALPEGQNRAGCAQACLGDDPDGRERADALLPCGDADRCPDLLECIAQSGPAVECAAHCALLDGCGLAADDCVADCDARWSRDRHQAYRACVADAADCAAIAECPLDPPPPCAEYCARIGPEECFFEDGGPACITRCDDGHFADPAAALARVACVLTAEACFDGEPVGGGLPHDIESCLFRDAPYGLDCLGYCRATTECAGDPDGLPACLTACGAGLVGDDGLRFLAGRDCLAALPADAACPAVSACVPAAADADCPALCDRADGCGLALAECPVRCVEDPLARLRALRAEVCIDEGADCEAVAACVLPPLYDPDLADVAPPVPSRDAFCAAFDACPEADFNFGQCDFLYDDLRDFGGPDGLSCGLASLQRCLPFLDDLFDCFGGGGRPPNPLVEPCAVLCEARRFCDADPDGQRVCEAACQDQYDPSDADALARLTPQMQCGSVWSCPELDACLDAATPEAICAGQCAARVACGQHPDARACAAECLADFGRAREIDRRACLADIAPNDCEAIAACAPPPPLPCDLACDALTGCGLGQMGCVERCEDAGHRDPATEAQRVACLIAAGDDCEAVAACEADPGNGGGACFGWCRATTECDPAAVEDLPACLTRCLVGFGDGDALRFASAEACLDAAGAGADCAALAACVPPEAAVDCDVYCDALAECGAPADACPADCAAAPDVEAAICVADARRTGGRCAGVAACVGFAPPPADPICDALCDRITGCDRAVDPFLCRLGCTPLPPAAPFQLACAEFAACGAALDDCLALDDTPDPTCVELCGPAVDACGLYPDAAACVAECTGREASDATPADYLDRAEACIDDATAGGGCDDAAAAICLQPASCDLRDDLIFFQGIAGQVDTDTTGLPDAYPLACAGGGAAEQIIVLTVAVPSRVVAEIIDADYDTALSLRAPCDGPELDCDDDGGEGLLSLVDLAVEPGTYYLFVEGFSDSVGRATVDIQIVAN